jgi:FlaA1/EpsC-like NDP-sugar epimerase
MSKGFLQYQTWRVPVCLGIEYMLLSSAIMFAVMLRLYIGGASLTASFPYLPRVLMSAAVCQLCMYYTGLYDLRVALRPVLLLGKLGQALGAGAIVLMLLFFILPPVAVGRGIFVLSLAFAACSLLGWRLLYQRLHTLNQFRINVLILGTDAEAQKLAEELHNHRALGYELRGFIGKNDEVGKDILIPQQMNP